MQQDQRQDLEVVALAAVVLALAVKANTAEAAQQDHRQNLEEVALEAVAAAVVVKAVQS